jgi:hypothetical protein
MADSTTTNFGFTKPEVGSSNDTWGTKLNDNWDDIDGYLNDKAPKASPAFTGNATFAADVTVSGTVKAQTYEDTFASLASNTVDLSTATVFERSLAASATFAFTNPPANGTAFSFVLKLTSNGNSVTWPSTVRWDNGNTPALSGVDVFVFLTHDGGANYYGFQAGGNMS